MSPKERNELAQKLLKEINETVVEPVYEQLKLDMEALLIDIFEKTLENDTVQIGD